MLWWAQVLDIVSKVALLAGGAIGLYLAWLRVTASNRQAEASLRQAELSRREHVAELFNRAVGQLGDPKLEIRLAAIYTLRQIGQDFPDLTGAVFELLNAYLRENPRDYGDADPPVDIREIMSIIRRGSSKE
jgi:hypothetical protein